MALEDDILGQAEVLVRQPDNEDMCGQIFAWLRADQRADRVFDHATSRALRLTGDDRAFRAGSLAGTIYFAKLVKRARKLAAEVARTPFDTGTPDERARIALEIGDAFVSVGQPELAFEPLAAAARIVRESNGPMRTWITGLILDQMTKIKHPASTELLDFVRTLDPDPEPFERGGYGRYESRIGQLDRAWTRAESLITETISLAVLLADIMAAAPGQDDRLRDLLAKVRDPVDRGTLLISSARGVSKHPELVGAALDMIEEGLARTSAAPPSERWDSVLYAAEILNDVGEHARAARLARESLEMLPQSPADELPRRTASTGRALARAGERAKAFELYIGAKDRWMPAIFLRDIAFSFPAPPER